MRVRSLSSRLTAIVLLSGLALFLVSALIRFGADRREAAASVEQSLRQAEHAHSKSLAESLWVVDRDRLALELSALIHLPYLESAEVSGPGVEPVRVERPGAKSSRRLEREFPLRRYLEGKIEELGRLRVTIGLDPLDRETRRGLVRRLLFEGAQTFCVSALLLLLVRRLVTRRLEHMAGLVETGREGGKAPPLPVSRPDRSDELDGLALAYNAAEARRSEEVEVQRACAALSRQLLNATSSSAKEIAQLVLDAALALTRSEHGYVAEVDADRRVMIGHTLTAMMGKACLVGADDRRVEFPARPDGRFPALWGCSLNTGESFYTNDPAKHPAWEGCCPPGHLGLSSFLSVPVLLDGRPAGQIALANRSGGYGERELRAVEQLNGLYAIALQRLKAEEQRRQIEAQLRQAQKMEAIGTLAGGIAHDFNNILSGIMGSAELTALRLPADSRERRHVDAILGLGERATNLVQQILAFSRQREPSRGPLNLQPVVEETLKLLRSSLPATIEIREDIPPDVGPVLADPTQIQQVVMNLCTNAFHAMRARGGVLGVRLAEVLIDNALAAAHPGLSFR